MGPGGVCIRTWEVLGHVVDVQRGLSYLPSPNQSLETWRACSTSSSYSQERGGSGKAPSPQNWPWP